MDILTQYTIEQLILIIFGVLTGAIAFWKAIEFFYTKIKNKFLTDNNKEDTIKKLRERQEQLETQIKGLERSIHILINSDKNDIKTWIVEKYRQVMKQGWVDAYDLDCIERRFADYSQEGGNSYIEDLVTDIRKLPKVEPISTTANVNSK